MTVERPAGRIKRGKERPRRPVRVVRACCCSPELREAGERVDDSFIIFSTCIQHFPPRPLTLPSTCLPPSVRPSARRQTRSSSSLSSAAVGCCPPANHMAHLSPPLCCSCCPSQPALSVPKQSRCATSHASPIIVSSRRCSWPLRNGLVQRLPASSPMCFSLRCPRADVCRPLCHSDFAPNVNQSMMLLHPFQAGSASLPNSTSAAPQLLARHISNHD
ncbi:hypothetical protein IWZ01DRAFT_100846 [Phyllosticta capitalensis]